MLLQQLCKVRVMHRLIKTAYDLRKLTYEEQKKLHLDFGDKDFDWMYSKKTIPVYMPNAELVLRHGYQHCGYMAAHPKGYVEEIEQFIRRPV